MEYRGIHLSDPSDRVSLKRGKIIGIGATATVYEWGDGKVIKLFNEGYPTEAITKEYYNALAVRNMDFHKARVHELIKQENSYGIVYDRLEGMSLLDYILKTGDAAGILKEMCGLQRQINKNAVKGEALGTAKQQLYWNMKASSQAESAATKEMERMLATMPEGGQLCHGDYHPGNVLMTKEGFAVIDYMNCCRGEALYDIARTCFLIGHTPVGEGVKDVEAMRSMKLEIMEQYMDEMGVTAADVGAYLSMIIAGRAGETGGKEQ